MKKMWKRIMSAMIVFAMVCGMLIIPEVPTEAASKNIIIRSDETTMETMSVSNKMNNFSYQMRSKASLKTLHFYPRTEGTFKGFVSAKSSNSKVATISTKNDPNWNVMDVKFKKAGTVTFTCVYNEEKYNYTDDTSTLVKKTVNFKVKGYKYVNPFKTVKWGKKNLTKKFNKNEITDTKNKSSKKAKLSVKVKSGYKLKAIYTMTNSGMPKVKNGKSIAQNNYATVLVVYNKKQKVNEEYVIYSYKEKGIVRSMAQWDLMS